MHFTDRFVASIRKPDSRKVVWEEGDYGKGSLGLRLSPSGSKTWVYMYRDPRSGKPRMATLGRYPSMSVAQAHEAFARSIQSVEQGNDPSRTLVESRQEQRLAPTVDSLATEYIERWAKPNKRSWREDERIIQHDVLPVWSGIKAADIKRRDIVILLDKIVARGAPTAANRALALVRKMFNFAVERAILEYSPAAGVKAPSVERRRDRVLTHAEIHTLWHAMWNNCPPVGVDKSLRLAILFQLATACRTNEALGMRWDEVDGNWWTIPASRAKNGNAHRVPLSVISQQILSRAKALNGTIFVFPSRRKAVDESEKPMYETTTSHAIARIISPKTHADGHIVSPQLDIPSFSSHDLRRTAATHMGAIKVPRLIISKILNHTDHQVTAIYDRHSYDDEKMEALAAWSHVLEKIAERP